MFRKNLFLQKSLLAVQAQDTDGMQAKSMLNTTHFDFKSHKQYVSD